MVDVTIKHRMYWVNDWSAVLYFQGHKLGSQLNIPQVAKTKYTKSCLAYYIQKNLVIIGMAIIAKRLPLLCLSWGIFLMDDECSCTFSISCITRMYQALVFLINQISVAIVNNVFRQYIIITELERVLCNYIFQK